MTIDAAQCELTILMPCLNESETIDICVRKAVSWLEISGTDGEVLIADNGSTDGSQQMARDAGARVVDIPIRGYGAAIIGGTNAARGRYVIMGDADDSYDFLGLDPFIEQLRKGNQLVMGNRFQGGIADGAMPWLHRYLGNPVLSAIGRLFFRVPIGDFHCGLRGFNREAAMGLGLQTTGMEFASELVVKSALAGFSIAEVPTTLRPDGRSRPPHLRTWSDGWRHLRFLLLFSPRWLFLIPGLVALTIGAIMTIVLTFTDIEVAGLRFSTATLVYSAATVVVGFQAVAFAVFSKVFAITHGFLPEDPRIDRWMGIVRLERGLMIGILLMILGTATAVLSVWRWSDVGFGDLNPSDTLRVVIPSALGLTIGFSTILSSFFLSILGLVNRRSDLD